MFTLLAVFPLPPAGFDGALLHFLAHFHQPLVGEVWNYRQECASRHNPACACMSWSMCAGLTSTGTLFSSVAKWVKPPHGVFTSMWRTWSLKHFSGFTVEMFSDSWPQMFPKQDAVLSVCVDHWFFHLMTRWRLKQFPDWSKRNRTIQQLCCLFWLCRYKRAATRCMFGVNVALHLFIASLCSVWKLPARWKQHFLFVTHAYFMSSRDHNCFFGRDVSH